METRTKKEENSKLFFHAVADWVSEANKKARNRQLLTVSELCTTVSNVLSSRKNHVRNDEQSVLNSLIYKVFKLYPFDLFGIFPRD